MCPEDPVSLAGGGLTCNLSVVAAVHPSRPVQLFATPWTAAHQAPLSCAISLEFAQIQAQRVGDAMGTASKSGGQWKPVLQRGGPRDLLGPADHRAQVTALTGTSERQA